MTQPQIYGAIARRLSAARNSNQG